MELPWRIHEYPGRLRYMSHLLGVSVGWVQTLLKPSQEHKLPLKHAETMRGIAEAKEAEWRQLRLDLEQFIAEKSERNRRATELHLRALRKANGKRTGSG